MSSVSSEWEYSTERLGFYAAKSIFRPSMEDRMAYQHDASFGGITVAAIFDGHGGEAVADYLEENFVPLAMKRIRGHLQKFPAESQESATFSQNISLILKDVCLELDTKLLAALDASVTGSTLVSAVLFGRERLFIVNVGDSRAVGCRNVSDSSEGLKFGQQKAANKKLAVSQLSADHKPHFKGEKDRIERSGGFVAWNGVWRLNGVLATSRAFGDGQFKGRAAGGLISRPDVFDYGPSSTSTTFSLLVLASDGLFDVLDNELVCRLAVDQLATVGPQKAAETLVKVALKKQTMDNVSCFVISLR